jgi:2-iminoacetate synthase ThiH
MLADAERQRLHPGGIVTYCLDPAAATERTVLALENLALGVFTGHPAAAAVAPVCATGKTAVDYLRVLAVCRLRAPVPHLQIDIEWTGLKLAQVALRFGADDIVNSKPGSLVTEEDVRRIIRDAGFIPKKRDPEYRSLSTY